MNAALVVFAWGKHGAHLERGRQVFGMLRAISVHAFCLRKNQDGSPEHPLYVPLAAEPFPFETLTV